MLRFISFGSGSSGNCYFLFNDTDALLIDAGVGVRTLKKHFFNYGLSLGRASGIIVTHDHADHIKSIGSLSRKFHLPVYATAAVHEGIDRNYCVKHKVEAERRRYIKPGTALQVGTFRVTPFCVPHDSSDNVGYQIEDGSGRVFCIMTDAGEVTAEMGAFIGRATHLVIEANHDRGLLMQGHYPQYLKERIRSGRGHLDNECCGEAIATNMGEGLQQVWLCHLSEENNHPELAQKTVEAVLRGHGITVGKDLVVEVLKRTIPTGIFDL